MVPKGLEKARNEKNQKLKALSEDPNEHFLFIPPSAGGAELLKTSRFSDFTVRCEGKEFHVHKAQLYTQSGFFRSLLDSDFKESAENAVTLEETSPVAVGMLLLIMYVGQPGRHLDEIYKMWPDIVPAGTISNEQTKSLATLTPIHDFFDLELKVMIDGYALADRLLMDGIAQVLAQHILLQIRLDYFERFAVALTTENSPMLGHIYASTNPSDASLRHEITLLCAHNRHKISNDLVKLVEERDGQTLSLCTRSCLSVKRKHAEIVNSSFCSIASRSATTGTIRAKQEFIKLIEDEVWSKYGV